MSRVYAGSYVPEQEHGNRRTPEKIIGYELEVFSYTDLFWHPRRNIYVVPGGLLKSVYRADVGELMANFILGNSPQAGFSYTENKARFPSKKAPPDQAFLLPANLSDLEQYAALTLSYRQGELIYNFKLRKKCVSIENPLEYRVTQYRSIDGKMEELESERIVPWFRKIKGSKFPDPDHFSFIANPEKTDPHLN